MRVNIETVILTVAERLSPYHILTVLRPEKELSV